MYLYLCKRPRSTLDRLKLLLPKGPTVSADAPAKSVEFLNAPRGSVWFLRILVIFFGKEGLFWNRIIERSQWRRLYSCEMDCKENNLLYIPDQERVWRKPSCACFASSLFTWLQISFPSIPSHFGIETVSHNRDFTPTVPSSWNNDPIAIQWVWLMHKRVLEEIFANGSLCFRWWRNRCKWHKR